MSRFRYFSFIYNLFRKFIKGFFSLMLILIFIIILPYCIIDIFYKEKNIPFSGDYLYNPYENFTPNTLKANFHSHSAPWFDLSGKGLKPEQVYNHYLNNGYDIISLSNYQEITLDSATSFYIPAYEHGYNIHKSHQLVINSKKVSYFDFPLHQNYHNKQQVLNKLHNKGGLIALAHPGLRNGYTVEDMKYLKGYDFIEVFVTNKVSTNIWDAALSNGYPAWILADDDCHDIYPPDLTFNNWNRISSSGRTREEIIEALKRGCHYGVRNLKHIEINYLDSCKVCGDELRVYFREYADKITFISDNGEIRKEVNNETFATYKIEQTDNYVRVEAKSGDELIYLNPIIRYNGYQLTRNNGYPMVDSNLTILFRFLALILSLSILLLILILNGGMVMIKRVIKSAQSK